MSEVWIVVEDFMCFKGEHVMILEGEEFKEGIVVLLLRKDIHWRRRMAIFYLSLQNQFRDDTANIYSKVTIPVSNPFPNIHIFLYK